MRELKLKGFEEATEEERRKKNYKKVSGISIGFTLIYIGVLVVGLLFIDRRECIGEEMSVRNGACVSCADKYC